MFYMFNKGCICWWKEFWTLSTCMVQQQKLNAVRLRCYPWWWQSTSETCKKENHMCVYCMCASRWFFNKMKTVMNVWVLWKARNSWSADGLSGSQEGLCFLLYFTTNTLNMWQFWINEITGSFRGRVTLA